MLNSQISEDRFICVIIDVDSLPSLHAVPTSPPSKSSSSSDSSDILSGAVLHKRRRPKRVRFALKLQSVEEDSSPSSRENSPSIVSRSSSRVVDPWRPDGPLYGAYVEYLEKQGAFDNHQPHTRRTPPPRPPPPPEPGAESPTYTHTFVIQSKSPDVVINSINVSTPSFHLPRIVQQNKKTNKNPLPVLDSYVKQQLTLSTSPRMTHSKKPTSPPVLKNPYGTVQAALKRAELALPTTFGLHANNKVTRMEHSSGLKLSNHSPLPTKKMTEIITRPLPGVNNQINYISDQSILPNYSKKPRLHNRTPHANEDIRSTTPYFCRNQETNTLIQPVIHFNR